MRNALVSLGGLLFVALVAWAVWLTAGDLTAPPATSAYDRAMDYCTAKYADSERRDPKIVYTGKVDDCIDRLGHYTVGTEWVLNRRGQVVVLNRQN